MPLTLGEIALLIRQLEGANPGMSDMRGEIDSIINLNGIKTFRALAAPVNNSQVFTRLPTAIEAETYRRGIR